MSISRVEQLLTGGGQLLVTGKKTTRCELSGWGLQVAVPEQVADILREVGIPFAYY